MEPPQISVPVDPSYDVAVPPPPPFHPGSLPLWHSSRPRTPSGPPSLPVDDSDIDSAQSPTVCSPHAGTSFTSNTRHIPRDSTYYIDEKMVVFNVDDTLFRVHRHLLRRESDVFDHMFSSPQPAGGSEGDSDENPITIPDVTRHEFVALMDHLYEGSFFKNKPGHKTSCEEYTHLLSIATRFMCIEARQKAIQGIESHNLDPIQKLVLADAFDIPQWLMPSYVELCKRDSPLTPDDALWIGPEKAMSIAKARENIRSSPETRQMCSGYYAYGTWPSGVFENSRVENIVNEALTSNIPPASPALPGETSKVNLESVGAARKWVAPNKEPMRKKKKGKRASVSVGLSKSLNPEVPMHEATTRVGPGSSIFAGLFSASPAPLAPVE